ncbi:MAG TPA: S41 family peptidase, partial [Bryobacteraceae bacterium]|nr:S41 family peptidase [Bryobacteraceae bacterium]
MRFLASLIALALPALAQLSAEQKQLNVASFEKVWTTVRDKHWEKKPGGLDWKAVHDELRPKIDKAETMDEARAIMRDMLGRLKQTHFGIFPADVYKDVDDVSMGEGSTGIDLRVLDGQVVVTSLDPGSTAETAGVKTGWAITSVNNKPLAPVLDRLKKDPSIHELQLTRAILARLSGPIGGKLKVAFLDGANEIRTLDLALATPRGDSAKFGNLPAMHVWFESKKFGNTGYLRFNVFLDLMRVMSNFSDAVSSCAKCDGIIIDLRGNPGGIGGMAMGMAGYLVDQADQQLGTMHLRDNTMKFVINPRPEVFSGPVAVLVDGNSASTSEILAGGLKDLGRARVFGTKSAAAALPSIIERLPNGDGFQYAIANYISKGGKPLEGLGVVPDDEVLLTRKALLQGHDSVVDAA